ncbi:TPR repeat-containing protein [Oribacterium sp. KHPX15]|uniref:tetratricopeptide repeat protein n=1 Tax=Oribacterium sp. KHPX15 TaxID=1855342 RepID=UPI0008991DC6|nr:tetratricopeptide repeat protein [Oribacterium sp. KHPX15]SDZ96314.1 TPR repeat-containing protein [Oribacterium sp. KHPX15]
MEKKSSPIIIICVLTGILLAALVGMLVFFNLPAQRIRRMLKTANKFIAEENYDEAILTLQKMIEIDPKNEKLYLLLADTYEKNGDTESKISLLQEAVKVLPEAVSLSEALGQAESDVDKSIFANSLTIQPGVYYQTNCTVKWEDLSSNRMEHYEKDELLHGTEHYGEDLDNYIVIEEENGILKFHWQNGKYFKMTGSFEKNMDGSYSAFNDTEDYTNDYPNASITSIASLSDTEIMILSIGDGAGYSESYITMKKNQSEILNNKAVSSAEAGNGWKKAYTNYITNLGIKYDSSGYAMYIYKLVNIDNDEIPELYISFGTTAGGDAICTYYDDQLIEQTLSIEGLTYLEGQNIFRNQGGSMDEYFDQIYSLKNGQFILLHEGEYGAADNSQLVFDSDGNPIYNYYWDGAEVNSEEEYMSLLKSFYDVQKAISPYDGADFDGTRMRYVGNGLCDYAEILDAINAY